MELLNKQKKLNKINLNNERETFINEIKQINKEEIVNSVSKIEKYTLWERLKKVFRMS